MCVNNLPRVIIWQRTNRESNSWSCDHEPDVLTSEPPSHSVHVFTVFICLIYGYAVKVELCFEECVEMCVHLGLFIIVGWTISQPVTRSSWGVCLLSSWCWICMCCYLSFLLAFSGSLVVKLIFSLCRVHVNKAVINYYLALWSK